MDLDHERRLTETEQRSKSNTRRLDGVEKWQADFGELIGTVKVLATKEAQVEADVKEIKDDVKSLTAKPGKRWEGIVDKAIFAVVGGIITFLLIKLGLGG